MLVEADAGALWWISTPCAAHQLYSTRYSSPEMFHVKQRSWFLPVGRCGLSPAGAAQSNLSQSDASVVSVSESAEARWVCAGARIGACQPVARRTPALPDVPFLTQNVSRETAAPPDPRLSCSDIFPLKHRAARVLRIAFRINPPRAAHRVCRALFYSPGFFHMKQRSVRIFLASSCQIWFT